MTGTISAMRSREIKIAATTIAFAALLGGAALFGSQNQASGNTAAQHTASQIIHTPLSSMPAVQHNNIITTVFWVGEPGDTDNGKIPNDVSAWDGHWQQHYGGVDGQDNRRGYQPAGFTPKENPFYVALPYNDIDPDGNRKSSAELCRPYTPDYDARYSACKNIWVAITHGNKTVYAQWEDVGPFGEDDSSYVFGTAKPRNTRGEHAGLDVSPAVQSELGLQDVDRTSWHFVQTKDVPEGPWKTVITTSKGDSL